MSDVTRSIKEGTAYGLVAGVIFATAQTIAAITVGEAPLLPFRMAASVLLGLEAVVATPAGTAFVLGVVAHLYLSAMFGLFYGVYNSALTMPTRRAPGRQAVVGLLFGAMLWLVNFHVVARVYRPWFLDTPQGSQMLLHAVFFGMPLGLLYASAERRIPVGVAGTLPATPTLPRARTVSSAPARIAVRPRHGTRPAPIRGARSP